MAQVDGGHIVNKIVKETIEFFHNMPGGYLGEFFQKNPALTHQVKCERIVYKLSKNSQYAPWVRPPLPPVSGVSLPHSLASRSVIASSGGVKCQV